MTKGVTETTETLTGVEREFAEYTAALNSARSIAERLKGRRVRYCHFGRQTDHVGTITGVRPTGITVRWDDPRAFWGGAHEYALHPDDLQIIGRQH